MAMIEAKLCREPLGAEHEQCVPEGQIYLEAQAKETDDLDRGHRHIRGREDQFAPGGVIDEHEGRQVA